EVHLFCQANEGHAQLGTYFNKLTALNAQWGELTQKIAVKSMQNKEEVGAAATDFLMFSGYVIHAFFWLKMAVVAQQNLDAGSSEAGFYQAKLATQEFYFERLLRRARAHVEALEAGADSLMGLSAGQF